MSDHWNSIANLLKTPSLGPTAKKSEAAAKPPKAALPPEQPKTATPEEFPMETAKAKPETSRLRSSWDAVATFFGVATPEQVSEKETSADQATSALESSISSKPATTSGRKSKPSMWGDPVEPVAKVDEPTSVPRHVEVAEVREVEPPRRPTESSSSDRGRSRDRGRGPREVREERPARSEISAVPQRDDDVASTGVPERRSQRHQPRRGRQADVRVESGFVAPLDADDAELDEVTPGFGAGVSEQVESDRPPRGRGPRTSGEDRPARPDRPPRSDRGPRPEKVERPRPVREEGFDVPESGERAERKARPDVTARNDRSEHPNRPARADADRTARPARPEREPRAERGERPPRVEGVERGHRGERSERPARAEGPRADAPRAERPRAESSRVDGNDRSVARERTARNAPRGDRKAERIAPDDTFDRRPGSPAVKKSSGFGAGIHDDDSFGFVDDVPEIEHEFEPVDDLVEDGFETEVVRENVDRESRPKRRRGRGRRSEGRGPASDADGPAREAVEDRDLEDDDSSEFISRNSRIPSWQDTIGTLVTVNMENHQRNQSGGRPQRGRGPRRDR